MRQGGLKPKSHSSGVYWVRASAKPQGEKSSSKSEEESPAINFIATVLTVLAVAWYFVS